MKLFDRVYSTTKTFVCCEKSSSPSPCRIYTQIFFQRLDIRVSGVPGFLQLKRQTTTTDLLGSFTQEPLRCKTCKAEPRRTTLHLSTQAGEGREV